jgi:hypothetical protein
MPGQDYQLGNEFRKRSGQYDRRLAAAWPVRERPPDTLIVRSIGHAAGTIIELSICLQSTPGLSATVADLAISTSVHRSQTGFVGFRCGQLWWSASVSPTWRVHRWETVWVTSTSPALAIRPGFRVIRGSTLTIPEGGLQLSLDKDGSPKLEFTRIQASIQTWTSWLIIAFARLNDTRLARKRMDEATANGDDAAESVALDEEFQGALQAISAAVFALDAFYGVIHAMIVLGKSEKEARQQNGVGRATWVADAICRASRMPNKAKKTVTKNIHTMYRLRDDAVHPRFIAEEYGIHPGLNQLVPKYYIDYTLETSSRIVAATVEAIMWVTDRPQTRNIKVSAYAPGASSLLHKIVDEFLTYETGGPFSSKQPEGTSSSAIGSYSY